MSGPVHQVQVKPLTRSPRGLIKDILESNGPKLDSWDRLSPETCDVISAIKEKIQTINFEIEPNGVHTFHCFLSYRERNSPISAQIARDIYDALNAENIHVFYAPECLHFGEEWREGFLTVARECKMFIPILTSETFAYLTANPSERPLDSVLIEYQEALVNKSANPDLKIYPVILSPFDPSSLNDYPEWYCTRNREHVARNECRHCTPEGCDEHLCENCSKLCEIKDYDFCCSELHRSVCSNCRRRFCNSHGAETNSCDGCTVEGLFRCSDCPAIGTMMDCREHCIYWSESKAVCNCDDCNHCSLCNDLIKCEGQCEEYYCESHGEFSMCCECRKRICVQCYDDEFDCGDCDEFVCDDCKDDHECGSEIERESLPDFSDSEYGKSDSGSEDGDSEEVETGGCLVCKKSDSGSEDGDSEEVETGGCLVCKDASVALLDDEANVEEDKYTVCECCRNTFCKFHIHRNVCLCQKPFCGQCVSTSHSFCGDLTCSARLCKVVDECSGMACSLCHTIFCRSGGHLHDCEHCSRVYCNVCSDKTIHQCPIAMTV